MWLAATNGFSLGSGLGTHCNRKRRLNAAVLRARLLLSIILLLFETEVGGAKPPRPRLSGAAAEAPLGALPRGNLGLW